MSPSGISRINPWDGQGLPMWMSQFMFPINQTTNQGGALSLFLQDPNLSDELRYIYFLALMEALAYQGVFLVNQAGGADGQLPSTFNFVSADQVSDYLTLFESAHADLAEKGVNIYLVEFSNIEVFDKKPFGFVYSANGVHYTMSEGHTSHLLRIYLG